MHHLEEGEVKEIMEKVKTAVKEEELAPEKIEEIFKLSKVASESFLNCLWSKLTTHPYLYRFLEYRS